MSLAAGTIFKLTLGSLLVWTGAVLGEIGCFIVGRCSCSIRSPLMSLYHQVPIGAVMHLCRLASQPGYNTAIYETSGLVIVVDYMPHDTGLLRSG